MAAPVWSFGLRVLLPRAQEPPELAQLVRRLGLRLRRVARPGLARRRAARVPLGGGRFVQEDPGRETVVEGDHVSGRAGDRGWFPTGNDDCLSKIRRP